MCENLRKIAAYAVILQKMAPKIEVQTISFEVTFSFNAFRAS